MVTMLKQPTGEATPLKFLLLTTFLAAFVSGCEQVEDVTIHEPGVYQGATDDLSVDTAALQDRLKNQMDR